MKRSLFIAKYQCIKYHVFSMAIPYGFPYGELVVRSNNNKLALLVTIGNPVFDEVSVLVEKNLENSSLNSMQKDNVFQDIFCEVCCDPDEYGSYYGINQKPTCPICQSESVVLLERSDDTTVLEISLTTYNNWEAYSTEEKELRVSEILKKYGYW